MTIPVLLVTAFTGLMVKSVDYDVSKQVTNIISGPIYPVYILVTLVILSFISKNFYKAYHSPQANSLSRQQILYTAFGIIFTFIWSLVTTTIWPQVTGDWQISKFGIIGSIFLGSFIGVAIIRHKLFDIRLVAARSLGYLLSIGTLAALYGFVSFGVINTILSENASLNEQRFTYTFLAVILAFTFQPLKRFFDKWTNKIFYQDAYDSQELLDNLNKILVSTSDIDKLLRGTSEIASSTLKTEYIAIGAPGANGSSSYRIIGTENKNFKKSDANIFQELMLKIEENIVVADHLESKVNDLKKTMSKNDIAVIVRLTDETNKGMGDVGYMIIGNKKSGSSFSSQDIKVLTMIADELVLAIQNALRFEEIQNFNKTLEQKVDDATHKLQKANDKLVALDQTKDDFISMASHQLRTPLTSVKGYLSMVLEGDAGQVNKDQKELLSQAFVSSQRMVYLISDLLNVSRLRTGKFVIDASPIDLADIVESEVAQLRETASARGLKLIYKKPKDFPVLMLDETKIRQVMTNYLDNAIYYTPTNGRIDVVLKDNHETIELLVQDSGIGVPKQEQHHLFTKFFRAGNAKKARPDGTGLGLFMAKKVIIAQGGAIIFTSTQGKGSTFGFTFQKNKLKIPEKPISK